MICLGSLDCLRALMRNLRVDVYIITGSDPHQNEYICEHWDTRKYISGFDGSSGMIAVTQSDAILWTDGRYHIQAEKQLREGFSLFKSGLFGVPDIFERLALLPPGSVCSFNPRAVSLEFYETLKKRVKLNFKYGRDLIDEIWQDRPPMPEGGVYLHETEFAGETHGQKLSEVRREMEKINASAYLITSLDDIAWLYNLRGNDMEFNPVCFAYAFVTAKDECLFFNRSGADSKVTSWLSESGIKAYGYGDIFSFVSNYKPAGKLLVNPERVSVFLSDCFKAKKHDLLFAPDITGELKAVKNGTQLLNIEKCQINDGAAVTKFIIWLKENINDLELWEHEIHEILFSYRKGLPNYVSPSFKTIAAFMENAAQMHYSPVKGADTKINSGGFLLIDSGAQYKTGTTDITRTVVLGKITDEMKEDFTLVLKSHIALAKAKWLHGSSGANLDIIARMPMWDKGMDYKSGTGHGIGYFASVHEGPVRIARNAHRVRIEAGMVMTNEPGIYRAGKWGVRTENVILAENDYENEHGLFMKFKTVSYCPIDLDGIITALLTQDEKVWLNTYHETVYEKLSPLLDEKEKEILREYTREI